MEESLPLVPARVPLRTWMIVAVALLVAYVVALDNGAVLRSSAATVHELFHDGRHFLGVPCH